MSQSYFWAWTLNLPPEQVKAADRDDAARRFVDEHKDDVRWADSVYVSDTAEQYRLVLKGPGD